MPSDAQSRDRTGEEVAGRYVIESEIGRGGMGAVYAARDTRLGRRVALKMLAADAGGHTRQRLETEARAVASIEHPGIVTLFDVVEHAGETALVMELVVGESLRDVMRDRTLTSEEVAQLVYEVSDALAAAHAKNLVHRDVKPDNMMLRADGRIALLDFGVAKVTSDIIDAFAPTTTGAGVIVGTPAYLAPEQARGEPISPATDQFALAVTAYELLTAQLPWPTTTSMLMVAAIISEPPIPIPSFDAAVNEVFSRALAKKPADRFPSVRDFANALGGVLGVAQPSRPRSLVPSGSGRSRVPSEAPSAPRLPSATEIGKTLRATERDALEPRPRRLRLVALAGIGLLGVAGAIALATHHHETPAPAASDAGATLAIVDIPPSETANAEARSKYKEALRQLSQGRGNGPMFALLDDAITLDPDFASAYLQRAYLSYRIAAGLDAGGRKAYRGALERKNRLSARDAELLNAIGPSFADPPDWNESAKRLEAMLARRPGDAEAWEALGFLRFKASDIEAARVAFEHEEAADKNAYTSYSMQGHIRAALGDLDGARKMFALCIERVPTTVECRGAIGAMYRIAGECASADRVARESVTLAPEQPMVFSARAESAASLGAPREALDDLFLQKRQQMPEARRAAEKANDDFNLAMRAGDFTTALVALDAIEQSADETKMEELARWVVARTGVLVEMGEPMRAATVALSFIDRMSARTLPEQPWQDPTGRLLAVANAAGRISNAEYVTRRDAWISGWRARLGENGWKNDGTSVWFGAYIVFAEPSALRANEALSALPSFGAYDVKNPDATVRQFDPEIGAVYFAADKLDEAKIRLAAATRWCKLVPYVRAFYTLGEVLAKENDVPGACAAFAAVERQWGHAIPHSVTVNEARAAAKKYPCAK